MNKPLEKTINVLAAISDEKKVNCLKQYTESIKLIKWLRLNVKDLIEFKFMVDLASLTPTGEYSKNNALFAKTLKDAGIAFAPLIFDLKLDDNFKKFISYCDIVWKNLENDDKIAEKLLAVKDKIDSLEKIKNKKGNWFTNEFF